MTDASLATPKRARSRRNLDVAIAIAIFVVLYGTLMIVSPVEASPFLITNFVVLATPLAIATIGTAITLIVGGFDLSVAGVISLANVISATTMAKFPDAAWLITLLTICVGLLVGLINGLLVTRLGLPSLGVTLAMYIMLSGVALVILPAPGGSVPSEWASALTGTFGPIPRAALVLLVLALLWMLFSRSKIGMPIFAVGGSLQAAKLSGIPTKRVQTLAYTIAGGLYACAGLYYSAMTSTGSPSAGTPFLLTCFAAAALGLVSFRGGTGSAVGAIMGAGTLTVIPKLLFALGVADFWVGAFQGLIVLVALCIPLVTGLIITAVSGRRAAKNVALPVEVVK